VACAAVTGAPVRLDRNGRTGGAGRAAVTAAAKSARIGSIIAEWNACEVRSRRAVIFRPASSPANRSTRSVGPATTQVPGPLTAAIDSSSGSNSPIRSVGADTASIVPAGTDCMSRPRAATRRSAAGSSKTPASVAATYSPTEWPIIVVGRTPHDCHSSASA
jgi:hypothetical protein